MPRSLFAEYGSNRQRQRPREEVKQIMRDVTQDYMEEMERDSSFFEKNPLRSIATFEPSEIEINKRIGMGEFGAILEVSKINLCDSVVSDTEDEEDDGEEDAGAADEETTKGGENRKPLHLHNSKSCGAFPTSIWDGAMTNNPTGTDNNTNDTNKDISPQNQRLRQQLANKVTRLSPQHRTAAVAAAAVASPAATNNPHRVLHRCRFAVKQIRKDLYPKKKIEAAKDLAREARLLSHLEHPNIIRLRATVGQPGDEDFMLMLDRLGTSLSEQVTQWQQQVVGTNGGALGIGFPWNLSSSSHRKGMERDILSDRLLALYDVARAMQYLHQKSILFRDLKTENVARNHHGAFQLLDFGLAKELKESNRVGELVTDKALSADGSVSFAESVMRSNSTDFDIDDTYKLTGLTGTLRIMSPEVLSCQPYGLSADVYSFGIVLWEVFHGDRNRLSAAEVVKGDRPELPVIGMPPRVDSLIRKCYGSPAFRPTFAMLSQELEYQLLELQQHQDGWQHSAEEALQHICLEQQHQQQANVFRRFDYLRQLSVQPLATTATTTTSAVAAVEN